VWWYFIKHQRCAKYTFETNKSEIHSLKINEKITNDFDRIVIYLYDKFIELPPDLSEETQKDYP
jgi:hypothetical protein